MSESTRRPVVGRNLSHEERLVFGVVSCLNLVPIWAFRFFPGQDTPNHLYGAEVIRTLLNGSAPASIAAAFSPALGFKSNILFHIVMTGLGNLGVPLLVAHKLFLSAYCLALPAAGLYCLSSINRDARALALLLLPLVWNWFVLQGLYNYVASLVPGLVWLGIVGRDGGRPGRVAAIVLAFAALTVYLAHSLTFVVLLTVTLIRIVLPGDGSSLPLLTRLRGIGPLLLALGPVSILAIVVGGRGLHIPAPPDPTLSSLEFYNLPEAIGAFFVEFAMRYGVWDLLILGPPLGALVAIPLFAAWRTRARSHALPVGDRDDTRRPPSWALVSAAVLSVAYVITPHIFSGSDVSPRLRVPIVFCLMCYAGVTLSPRVSRRLAALALVSGVLGMAILIANFVRFGHDLDDFTSGIPLVPEGSRLYPMVFDPRGPSLLIRPMLHAWGYYGLERHVVTPFAFAWHPTRFPYRYRELPLHEIGSALPSDAEDEPYALVQGRLCASVRRLSPSLSCAAVREQAEGRLADLARAYDYLLTWAAPSDFPPLLLRRGYRLVHVRGALSLYRSPR